MGVVGRFVVAVVVTAVSVVVAAAELGRDASAATRKLEDRLVFVSPVPARAGFVGGLTGADLVCRRAAEAHGLSGVFLAWLGDGEFGPANRFDRDGAPLVNVRGERVASGWRQLASGRPAAPALRLDGTPSPVSPWTNVALGGTSGTAKTACNRWWSTRDDHMGAVGVGSQNEAVAPCDSPRPFFCVEQ